MCVSVAMILRVVFFFFVFHAEDGIRGRLVTEVQTCALPIFKITARGGGTGTNGQSLTEGIVLDCSRYMNRIIESNFKEGWVCVEPGVVLDQLNEHLAPNKVFFAPDLSPSNRATLGGMVNTDACGKGSRIYGRTSDHVLELTCVLSNGEVLESVPLEPEALSEYKKKSGISANIFKIVDQVVSEIGRASCRERV